MITRCLGQVNQWLFQFIGIVICIGTILSCAATSKNPPQGIPPLWHRANLSGEPPRSPETLEIIPVMVDAKRLESTENTRFSLLLPDGELMTVVKARQERVGGDGFVWHGKVENNPYSLVTFSVVKDMVIGTVIGSDRNFYRLSHGQGGVHYIEKVKFYDRPSPPPLIKLGPTSTPPSSTDKTCKTDVPGDDGLWPIDVMVAYTKGALDDAGGIPDNIRNTVDISIGQANQSYLDSGIKQKLNLVYLTEVTYPEDPNGNMANNLAALNSGIITDNQGVAIPKLRDANGADVVVLIVKCKLPPGLPSDADCQGGLSDENINPPSDDLAYSVVVDKHVSGPSFAFIHELGHVMGANHDYSDTSAGNQYPYSTGYNHGHVQPDTSAQNKITYPNWYPWGTIMAIYDGCQSCARVPVWSNSDPTKTWEGDPTGSKREDNARMLNEMLNEKTTPNIANFRCHVPPGTPTVPIDLNLR